jgi:mannose-6-phosphate isomerase-like protein (cupin superfamily)
VSVTEATNEGKAVGNVGVFLDGSTASTGSMQVGRMLLNPGAEPHAPHTHAEEELLIVTRGSGEVLCDGTKVAVKPGAVISRTRTSATASRTRARSRWSSSG